MTVLYLMGYGRSGSTIIGNILGNVPGLVHVGELRSLFGLGMLGKRVCGCGQPISRCGWWQDVLVEAFGDNPPRWQEVVSWQREAVRLRNTRRLLRMERNLNWDAVDRFSRVMSSLYRAIAMTSGAEVIVDSSKHIPDAALLHLIPGIRPYLVHLVRDPRAVAFSWKRKVASPGEGRNAEMPIHSAARSARSWLMTNLAAEFVKRSPIGFRSLRIRYEDFAAFPEVNIDRILTAINRQGAPTPFISSRAVALAPTHSAGGNPSRLQNGPTSIKLDDQWRHSQGRLDRWLATGIALPLLRRYRYPLRPFRELDSQHKAG